MERWNEPRHDKTNKVSVRPAKTQISLGIRPVWSVSSLAAWRNLGSLATHWAHSEDSDQTGRIPRLIWVFTGRTLILLVLSCHGLNGTNINSIPERLTLAHFMTWYPCRKKESISFILIEFVFYVKIDVSPLMKWCSFVQKLQRGIN